MDVELTDHLGSEPHQEPPGGTGNTLNGATPKTLITDNGPVPIDTPRDRNGSLETKIVGKRQRRFEGATTRSWRSTPAGCPRATSRRTWPRSTASRSAGI
jgi:putative transposase